MRFSTNLLWLVPALPFAGALLLGLIGHRLSHKLIGAVACATVGVAALLVAGFGVHLWAAPDMALVQTLWRWFMVDAVQATVTLRLDGLALVMALVVTGVGLLVHIYSIGYMAGAEGYARYFAWLNLFVGAMLLLVLADDLLLLYLGWEGVGLCSYLLIGFWYRDAANGAAARKAFVVTRIGDTALLLGLILLVVQLGTFAIPDLLDAATTSWTAGAALPTLAAFLLLGGAVGKSAQLPLHVWLPDAMAGPTPVSALIHAATMVTAGVYLIARMQPLFALAPIVLTAIAWVGAATLLLAAWAALAQAEIKRVLAWSTISQIGYMFLALGVGATGAAVFHLFTHAMFKALLFLAAGTAILALGHEQRLAHMGGLRRLAPLAFWGFAVGAASLAALPFVTAGFFSKEAILGAAWQANVWLWLIGWTGAVMTAAYAMRVFAAAFLGSPRGPPVEREHHVTGWTMKLPIILLIPLALVGGLSAPAWTHLGVLAADDTSRGDPLLLAVGAVAPVLGIAVWLWWRAPVDVSLRSRWGLFAHEGAYIGRLYDRLVVSSWRRAARAVADDPFDGPVSAIGDWHREAWHALSRAQNGRVRRYAAGIVTGAAIVLAVVLL